MKKRNTGTVFSKPIIPSEGQPLQKIKISKSAQRAIDGLSRVKRPRGGGIKKTETEKLWDEVRKLKKRVKELEGQASSMRARHTLMA